MQRASVVYTPPSPRASRPNVPTNPRTAADAWHLRHTECTTARSTLRLQAVGKKDVRAVNLQCAATREGVGLIQPVHVNPDYLPTHCIESGCCLPAEEASAQSLRPHLLVDKTAGDLSGPLQLSGALWVIGSTVDQLLRVPVSGPDLNHQTSVGPLSPTCRQPGPAPNSCTRPSPRTHPAARAPAASLPFVSMNAIRRPERAGSFRHPNVRAASLVRAAGRGCHGLAAHTAHAGLCDENVAGNFR